MKFIRTICLSLCFLMLVMPVMRASAEIADVSVSNGCRTVDAASALGGSEKLLDTSKAVLLYERSTNTLVYGYNIDTQIYPASMVKMMTALVALKYGELDAVVTVSRSALNSVAIGSVSAGLVRDEQITLRDLLYCTMVASANDASAVIAEYIGGSQEGFVELMNEMASEIGCTGTHFSNAHGLHDADTYTTARDILRILEVGLADETFKTMFETARYTVPATNKSEAREVMTTNYMMASGKYFDSRVTGGKTGATNQAGRCLAVTADVGEMELIAIVMGAQPSYTEDGLEVTYFGSFEEMDVLLDYAENNFECRKLFYENQVIAQYSVSGGSNVAATPADEAYCVLPKNVTADELLWSYDSTVSTLSVPVAAGQSITPLQVWYNGLCLAQTELVAMTAVQSQLVYQEPDNTDILDEQSHGRLLAAIIGVLLGIVVLFFAGLFAVRMIQTAVIKARIRRRRKNRRRNRNARME